MTEIINPEFLQTELKAYPKKWQIKYGYPIIIGFLAVALSIVVYMIYHDYYEPNYKLINFLPNDYTLAVEYKKTDDNLSKIQLMEILNQPTFKNIYLKTSNQIDNYINAWPLSFQSAIKETEEGVLFLTKESNYGLLIKLKSKNQVKKIKETAELKNAFFKIINQEILVISNNQELLDQTIKTKTKPISAFNLEVSLIPWLEIYFDNNFFNYTFTDSSITNLQTILKPLSLTGEKKYQLQLTNKSHQLIVNLIPKTFSKTEDQIILDNYLNYIPQDSKIALGLNDLNILISQLETNQNLNNYFSQSDFLTWITNQLSISSLTKNFNNPVIFSTSDNSWEIITNTSNKDLIDGLLKNYLAQFKPITQKITLPDGTQATEIITDPSLITWNIAEKDGWQIFNYSHPQKNSLIGYAINADKLIIGNKIEVFGNFRQTRNCILPQINLFLSIKPQNDLIIFDQLLQNFANISAVSSNNGQIMLCFDLK